MKHDPGLRRLARFAVGAGLATLLTLHVPFGIGAAQPPALNVAPPDVAHSEAPPVAALSPYIDVHVHMDPSVGPQAIEAAVGAMKSQNNVKYIFLPSPFPDRSARSFDIELIRAAAARYPGKIAVMGGGGTLNPMLQEAMRAGTVDPALKARFIARAEEIAQLGAVGLGELAVEHRPSSSTPSYQSVPPDHPLLLALADIAAKYDLPITLHMEAVPESMPLPSSWRVKGLAPQTELRANIAGLERLLAYNPRAKIVWAHGGWDNTGFRTPELCRKLLAAHPNLYMELKIDPRNAGLNSPLSDGATGALKQEWLELFKAFPTRFVLGSDQHFPVPDDPEQRWQALVRFFNTLPADLRRQIGTENVYRIYKLN